MSILILGISLVTGWAIASFLFRKYPQIYCSVHGHAPKCSIEDRGVIKFTCTHCKRQVRPE